MPFGAGIWNVQWLNANSQRNYPLSEEATLVDTSGSFHLPLSLIVDLVWPVHATAAVESDKFHLYNVSVFGEGITLTFGYDGTPIGSVSVSQTTHIINQSYFISGIGDFYDSVGKITIGDLTGILSTGGSYNFNVAGGRLEPTVIRPNLKGVTAIIVINGQERSEPLFGDVELAQGRNIEFTVTDVPGGNPRIRIDATATDDLNEDCACGNLTSDAPAIRTVNGVYPDDTGNIELVSADDCLLIEADGSANIVKFTDQCSKSCCGCDELNAVVTDLNLLNVEISTLSGVSSRLEVAVSAALTNLLASRTGELPCGS
ncbi:MAG TPA: hypothetical protein ENH11_01705 [Candidatus Acetothermia bacterium]|nr:hypothetical protein [Candidatus Acetothermia bacterium]